jgi:hypothetical protein
MKRTELELALMICRAIEAMGYSDIDISVRDGKDLEVRVRYQDAIGWEQVEPNWVETRLSLTDLALALATAFDRAYREFCRPPVAPPPPPSADAKR